MKRSIFYRLFYFALIASCILIINSCQKEDNGMGPDNNNSKYYFSFKANGEQIKYTGFSTATLEPAAGDNLYGAVILTSRDYIYSDKEEGFIIIIWSNRPVSVDTYQDPQKATDNDGTKFPEVLLNYIDKAGNDHTSAGLVAYEDGHVPGAEDAVADAKVSITKLTSTYIEGTFSGTTYLDIYDDGDKTKVVISEGKFKVKLAP